MTITEFIRADITARLQAGQELPYKLTLSEVSQHYDVSLTPVRFAIDALVADGLIRRLSTGRLELLPGKSSKRTAGPTTPSAPLPKRDLADLLRKEVIEHSLRQESNFLREEATAEKYGAGRTVVRQVFSRLAGAGLLEHIPRRGWRVKPFNEADMSNYLDIRETLELKALDQARPRFQEAELRELLEHNRPGQGRRPSRLDNDLHDYWISRCDNRYLQEFFARYSEFYNTLFNYAVINDEVKREMAVEHCDIITELLAQDWRAARRALSLHIRDQQGNVARMIESLR